MGILLARLLIIYSYCIGARVVMSWIPLSPGGAMASVFSFLFSITEPVLRPLRQVIPPVGGLDLSPLLVFFAIQLLVPILAGAG